MSVGRCECGCGGVTAVATRNDSRAGIVKGKPRRFINGHQVRALKYGGWNRKEFGEDFWERTQRAGDCIVWTAGRTRAGYGAVGYGGQTYLAHQVAYKLRHGEFPPDGRILHHLCENPLCVNPDHLEPVTRQRHSYLHETGFGVRFGLATHCPQGHPYDDENTVVNTNGARMCRTCLRARGRLR